MEIQILGQIASIEVIAIGGAIRNLRQLEKRFGPGRWRKLKGVALVRLPDGVVVRAEVHWYEAHGLGRKDVRIKRLLN
jgi:hypothetical protein